MELPGGFKEGDVVLYQGLERSFPSGDRVAPGMRGVVRGLAKALGSSLQDLAVKFDLNKNDVSVNVSSLARQVLAAPTSSSEQPPLVPEEISLDRGPDEPQFCAGGFSRGDVVFYQGQEQTYASGDSLRLGQLGVVSGTAVSTSETGGTSPQKSQVAVMFEGNKVRVTVRCESISHEEKPWLAGGLRRGDIVVYVGPEDKRFDSGDRLAQNMRGVVAGAPTATGSVQDRDLTVLFDGNKHRITVQAFNLARQVTQKLAGGFERGDMVIFQGNEQTFASRDRIAPGLRGMVVGPATAEGTSPLEDLAVLFDGNRSRVTVEAKKLVRRGGKRLPGGFDVGDVVYYQGAPHTFASGDRLAPGLRGVVSGPAIAPGTSAEEDLAVLFDGNRTRVTVQVASIAREDVPRGLRGLLAGLAARVRAS